MPPPRQTQRPQGLHLKFRPPGPVAEAFFRDRTMRSFIRGPIGSGKTYTAIFKILDLICEMPPTREGVRKSMWLAIRNTYPELKKTTILDWMRVAEGLGHFSNDFPPTHYLRFQLPDGTRVEADMIFLALDRPDSVRKLKGYQLSGVWVNEAKELPYQVVEDAFGRTGRYPLPTEVQNRPRWLVGDLNSPSQISWYYRLAEKLRLGVADGWAFFTQPGGVIQDEGGKWVANPAAENIERLGANYYTDQVAGASEMKVKVDLANQYGFSLAGRPIYPEYQDTIHCRKDNYDPPEGAHILIGWDYGLTPAAALMHLRITPDGPVLEVFDELVTERAGIIRLTELCNLHLATQYPQVAGWTDYGDPQGGSAMQTDEKTCYQEQARLGHPITKGLEGYERRFGAVRHFLTRMSGRTPMFQLSPRCGTLREGFSGGYRYRQLAVAGEERFTNEPDKSIHSHVHEALQYPLTRLVEATRHAEEQAIQRAKDRAERTEFIAQADAWRVM